jgi:hypothetical protein
MKKYTITSWYWTQPKVLGHFCKKQGDVMIASKLEQIILEFVDMFMLVRVYAY